MPDDVGLLTTRQRALPPPRTSAARRSRRAAAAPPPRRRRTAVPEEEPGSLGRVLGATAAAAAAPGSGHLILGHRRLGGVILGTFLLVAGGLAVLGLTADREQLLKTALTSNTLLAAAIGCLVVALAWAGVIVHTYLLGQPPVMASAQKVIGVGVVTALCLVVAAPLSFGAYLANSQRNLLNDLFGGGGGTDAAIAITKPQLNILLVGSDAGPDRKGTRTDTMMVANVDTRSGRTILFSLPRNIQKAQFPKGSPMAKKFPKGFHNDDDPRSGDYLLNAVYPYALNFPDVAPDGPTADPGLNLLHQTVGEMLGLQLDYYIEVNMAGFESIIDALGGLTVDVGPEKLPVGGIGPSGQDIKPEYYIPAGVQNLSGKDALAFARSRKNSDDYTRMGRQRCLLQYILQQKSPTDMLANFQSVAKATTNSVSTNIPQAVLPALSKLADSSQGGVKLESLAFDLSLPDPSASGGTFLPADPNFKLMKKVVQEAINRPPPPPVPPPGTAGPSQQPPGDDTGNGSGSAGQGGPGSDGSAGAEPGAPQSVASSC